ncbi:MFS transporter [Ammonicoccus fulvus]|uniref:MFS transporter n=1 Tax=Ammonicoccus fulvus TaxID=3138240 RepID=A0ABZ3FR70_9ACTN
MSEASGPGRGIRGWVRRRTSVPRDVIVLGMIAFSVAVGFGVVVPVLPVFAKSFEVTNFQVAMVVSAFAFMRLLMSPFCGRLADWLGERATLAVGIFIVAISSAVAGLSTSYEMLLLSRGLGGIGSAMFTVSAMTLLLKAAPPAMRGRAAGFFQSGFLIGGMTGPAIGGLLAAISITAPFFFYAGTLAVAGTIGLALLSKPERAAAGVAQIAVRPMHEVAADPRFQAACVSNLAQGWNNFGVRNALVPLLALMSLDRGPTQTGYAFAIAAVVQTLALAPVGKFVDQVGRKPAMIAGGLLGAAVMATLPLVPSWWMFIVVLCLGGVAAAALGTAPAASVGDAAGAKSGTPVAVFSMFSDLGAIIGPLVAGWLADTVSMTVGFAVGAALLALGSLVSVRMPAGVPTSDSVPPENGAEPTDPPSATLANPEDLR